MSQPSNRVITTARRKRLTKTGKTLSAELIVHTAIRLLGQHGADALTVRRLGVALGADPSSVYRYFTNTDDLVLAVADELTGRVLDGFRPVQDWRESLWTLGQRIHAVFLAHPHAGVLVAARVTGRPNEIRTVETGLDILRGAGFTADQAARHYHSYIDLTLGIAALDAASRTLPRPTMDADRGAWRSVYGKLPEQSHPNIAAGLDALAETMSASAYPAALALFLDGLAAQLPRPAPTAANRVAEQAPRSADVDGAGRRRISRR